MVCSDKTSGGSGENEDIGVSELVCDVTTDPKTIKDFLSKNGTRVLFCTYQSLEKIIKAQKSGARNFDLTICDEAHRTTGVGSAEFMLVHNEKELRSSKRLYMTATQKIYDAKSKIRHTKKGRTVIDMDDDIYGPVFHRLSFKNAVDARILSDYRVIIMVVREGVDNIDLGDFGLTGDSGGLILDMEDMIRLSGVLKAINGITGEGKTSATQQFSKVIGFANSIQRSKEFKQLLNNSRLHEIITKDAGIDTKRHEVVHLDGNSSALERNKELRDLENADLNNPRMICNVRLFTEGVDVPSLDAVAFIDPRDSAVDVVQAVGRVMRHAEGKQFGYVIIPVLLEADEDYKESLESNPQWEMTGRVLRALQAHDGRLPENPAKFVKVYDSRLPTESGGTESFTHDAWEFDEASEKFYAHVVSASGLSKPGKAEADEIRHAVGMAANLFERAGISRNFANALDVQITEDGDENEYGFSPINVCKIAALLMINACMLQRRLLDHIPEIMDLNDVNSSPEPITMLRNSWTQILEQDYHPVFRPALDVLEMVPGDLPRPIHKIVDCANRIADKLSELGYDHSGPLYHDVLGTAKSDSALYTKTESAVMLARLAFSNGIVDWSDKEAVGRMLVIDPACGTGTLLMASLQTMKHNMNAENNDAAAIHRMLVDDVLCGLDINHHAIQMAACNFTLGAPTIDYQHMRLVTMPHGPHRNSVKSGSVEILLATNENDTMQALVQPRRNTEDLEGTQVDNSTLPNIPLSGYDVVIMNPPFGNNQKRNSKFPPEVARQLQENEMAIRDGLRHRDRAAGDVIDSNSIQTFFVPLADRLLNKKNGTLAMVAPVTVCVGSSASNQRRFLADRFYIERIVSSHDPKRINFSYNTSIHECLLVCRRGKPNTPTEFVSLRKMPATMGEAATVADAIVRGEACHLGSVYFWPADRMAAGDWSPVQWYDQNIVEIIDMIESSQHLEMVSTNHAVGPDGRAIRDTYEKCGENVDGAVRTFDLINADIRTSIHGEPETWRRPKDGKQASATNYWEMRSNLLVATRFRTTSSRLTAVYTDSPSVGSAWIPVSVLDEREAKALAAWWNSTPALMMLLNRRRKLLDYPAWSMEDLNEIRVPKSDNPAWDALCGVCEEVMDTEMPPFNSDAENPLRRKIDEAAALALDMDPDILTAWRRRLLKEPTISNKMAEEPNAQQAEPSQQ